MEQQTAMQKLLDQLKHERQNLPISIEWDRCYQSIEMVIQNTYLQMEKEQMFNYIKNLYCNGDASLKFHSEEFEQYYNETYKQ